MTGMELRVFTEPQQGASYDDLLRVAQTTEELGFGAFFRSDHFLAFGSDGLPGPTDSWVTLGALARETSTIRLGTLVTSATFRSPGLLAIQVAQVDQMSGGRVELGIGAGWFAKEHAAYGFSFPDAPERFDMLEDRSDHLLLEVLAVAPGQQGSGVGHRLMALADEQAVDRGFDEVRLFTNARMTENLVYYPRQGYVETHREEVGPYLRVFFTKVLAG